MKQGYTISSGFVSFDGKTQKAGARPYISVVIPVKNGGTEFERCLEGLLSSNYSNYEVIVVDDGSTDNSPIVAKKYGAKVIHVSGACDSQNLAASIGPAGARNLGVSLAAGEVILFIDSDVVPQKDNLRRVAEIFQERVDIDAVFGAYDNAPGCKTFISQYRNLLHAYIHQISSVDAETFWAGCGAIRKEVFLKLGGFDNKTYVLPSVEDIDLGYRMSDAGYNIYLDKHLRVKHLKKWTFKEMLKTDVFHRAIPWARIICKRKRMPNDLNIRIHHRISGIIVVISVSLLFLVLSNLVVSWIHKYDIRLDQQLHHFYYGLGIPISIATLGLVLLLTVGLIMLNRRFYAFLYNSKGFLFTLKAIPLHFFYYFYSTITFTVFLIDYHTPPLRWLRRRIGLKMRLINPVRSSISSDSGRIGR